MGSFENTSASLPKEADRRSAKAIPTITPVWQIKFICKLFQNMLHDIAIFNL
jgi:hypothetical protein